MSVQFGRWNFEGEPMSLDYIRKVRVALANYGPDGERCHSGAGISILYGALHTTKESRKEIQPYLSHSGIVLTWDGRLDNSDDLIRELSNPSLKRRADVAIVSAAYEQWGTECFGRLVGDWALSIWNPLERSLILAKDFLGTRPLYYALEARQVTWSTILDPLVLLSARSLTLDEEYLAGWLGSFPAARLTPYAHISAVPPSTFVLIRAGTHAATLYQCFDFRKTTRYRSDGEYEEHFRKAFAESVRRRLRSDMPILAELSGGMDSSSIVCMADTLLFLGEAEAPRLDTVSYYNDSEPNWNERPFFTKIEERRGRVGCHIDVSTESVSPFELEDNRFKATPASSSRLNTATKQFIDCMRSNGNRVLLSGIGGDEMLGGVPTPLPELGDLLARGRLKALAHQLKAWALVQRKPWLHLFSQTAANFLPTAIRRTPPNDRVPNWLRSDFVRRNQGALLGYPNRWKFPGNLPSLQSNLSTLESIRRQLGCSTLSSCPPYEKSYPCLDRDLLAFLFAIPREQIIRPGQRRSLMRRALRTIVPSEILDRRRKAFVARAPFLTISSQWTHMLALTSDMLSDSLGIVDEAACHESLRLVREGHEVPIVPLIRTLSLETWLRDLFSRGVLPRSVSMSKPRRSPFATRSPDGVLPIERFNPTGLNVSQHEGGRK